MSGRPTVYTAELAERICERIAESNDSLRKICRETWAPSRSTVNKWLIEREEFRQLYMLSIQGRVDDIALECLEIADDATRDYVPNEETLEVKANKRLLERVQIQLAERHWIVACLAPKRYGREPEPLSSPGNGDDATLVNENEESPVQAQISFIEKYLEERKENESPASVPAELSADQPGLQHPR